MGDASGEVLTERMAGLMQGFIFCNDGYIPWSMLQSLRGFKTFELRPDWKFELVSFGQRANDGVGIGSEGAHICTERVHA